MEKDSNINLKEMENRAWKRLYSRIECDGLLEKETPSYTSPATRFAKSGLAVSFMFVLIASVFVFRAFFAVQQERLLIKNSDATSTYVTTLEDGSTVYLTGNTSLSLPKHFGKLRRETKLDGDAFFEISKNRARPFVVETKLIKIEVLGTSFNVTSNSVNVRSGKVRVWLRSGGESVTLTAGHSVNVTNGTLNVSENISTDSIYNSISSKIHFRDEKLRNVVNVLNRSRYHITGEQDSIILSPEAGERVITASFANESAEESARLICIVLGLKYDKLPEGDIKIHI
jgi:ferric-dicitrate binding protein FerR (iron transport regulator)